MRGPTLAVVGQNRRWIQVAICAYNYLLSKPFAILRNLQCLPRAWRMLPLIVLTHLQLSLGRSTHNLKIGSCGVDLVIRRESLRCAPREPTHFDERRRSEFRNPRILSQWNRGSARRIVIPWSVGDLAADWLGSLEEGCGFRSTYLVGGVQV